MSNDVVNFYTRYDEAGRLERHPVEFATTTYQLAKWLKPHAHVLDVGAGAGSYSVFCARNGHVVTAIDVVPKHIRAIESTIDREPGLPLSVHLADARNLSRFCDRTFDSVLCMGPIYHLNGESLYVALKECLRVLKDDGIFFGAYVNKYVGFEVSDYRDVIISRSRDEIEGILAEINLEVIFHEPVDGPDFGDLDRLITEKSQSRDLSDAHLWIDCHPSIFYDARRSNFIHALCIAQKHREIL